jgi:hypothetical protein
MIDKRMEEPKCCNLFIRLSAIRLSLSHFVTLTNVKRLWLRYRMGGRPMDADPIER